MAWVTFTDIVTEVTAKVEQAYNRKEWNSILSDIDSILAELNGSGISGKLFQNFTADELSRIWGRLAVLRSSLLTIKDEAFKNWKIAEQYCRVKEAGVRNAVEASLSTKLWKKPTETAISVEVHRQMAQAKLESDLHQARLEKINSYWYSIPDILYRIETRIKLLSEDRSTAKFYGSGYSDAVVPDFPEVGQQAVSFDDAMLS